MPLPTVSVSTPELREELGLEPPVRHLDAEFDFEPLRSARGLQAKNRSEWIRKRFITWLALPKAKRPDDCRTERQFAELVQCGETFLYLLKQRPGFWDEVYKEASALVGDELPEIVKAMVQEAKMGSVKAARFCFEMLGIDKPQRIEISEPLTVILSREEDNGDRT